MPIKFEKTQEKLRKNLMKQFETFNHKPDEEYEGSRKYESDSVKKSNITQQKPHKSTVHVQMTTQAKSPLIKSASSSKARLTQHQKQPQSLSALQSQPKSLKSSKKSLYQSASKLRTKTPPQQLSRSRQSSPQAQRVYSKLSSYDKRALSKMSNYKKPEQVNKNQHEATYGAKSSSKTFTINQQKSRTSQIKQAKKSTVSKLTNQKSLSKNKKSSTKNNEAQYFQMSFPQMITESESVYPSSSQPNTGKQSQKQQNHHWQRKRNSNILQQEEHDFEQAHHDDYIDEEFIEDEQMRDSQHSSSFVGNSQAPTNYEQENLPSGYQQLPKSYLIAMQILQAKVNQQESMIKRLKQKLQKQDQKYTDLQVQFSQMQSHIQLQQSIISQKDAQIKFLKGYLDEEKHNNRQALKQVAKNVFERSISGKKTFGQGFNNQDMQSMTKAKKQLFVNGNDTEPSKNKKVKIKDKQNQLHRKQNQRKTKKTEQVCEVNNQTQDPLEQQQSQQQEAISKKRQQNLKSSKKQIKKQQYQHEKQVQQNKQRLLKQELVRQEIIKDEMMREQILRQEELKRDTQKKYNYLEQSHRKDRATSVKQTYPNTVKKQQAFGLNQSGRKGQQQSQRQPYSEGKRLRSMSTAVKYLNDQNNPNITYRPRANQNLINGQRNHIGSPLLTPSAQSVMDPVLQRYIQAKSDISSYRFQNDTAFFNQGLDIKSDKRHKQTVSEMRQLMRSDKQLVALNYKLQAIERRILQCVKSTGRQDKLGKSLRQQTEEKMALQDLQRQHAAMKKEFQRKQVHVKQIKMNLDKKE